MIRDRQVSAVEVLDSHLAQIAKHNSKLNAICTSDEDNARSKAKQVDEALLGGENGGLYMAFRLPLKIYLKRLGYGQQQDQRR